MVKTQIGKRIKTLQLDNDGEYTSNPFFEVFQDEGFKEHFTVCKTPQQNRVTKHINRILVKKIQCKLSYQRLSKAFQEEALNYAHHISNRLPKITLNGRTILEVWSSSFTNDCDFMYEFGCSTCYHITESKLDSRAKKVVFLGFNRGVKNYRLWCSKSK